jgi:hypothetical protein
MLGDLPGVDATIAARFHRQFWKILLIVGSTFALIVVVWCLSYYWMPIDRVGAQQAATPVAGEVAALRAQMDEISKSQDRFQQTLLAVVTIVGTGLVALIGFNFIAANRNAALESDFLRDYAVLTTDKAVTAAESRFEGIVNEQGERAELLVTRMIPTAEQSLKEKTDREAERLRTEVGQIVDAERKGSADYLKQVEFLVESLKGQNERADRVASQALQDGFSTLLEMTYLSAQDELRRAEELVDEHRIGAANSVWLRVFSHGLNMIDLAYQVGAPALDRRLHFTGLEFVVRSLKGSTNQGWADLNRLARTIEKHRDDESSYQWFVDQLDAALGRKDWRQR